MISNIENRVNSGKAKKRKIYVNHEFCQKIVNEKKNGRTQRNELKLRGEKSFLSMRFHSRDLCVLQKFIYLENTTFVFYHPIFWHYSNSIHKRKTIVP